MGPDAEPLLAELVVDPSVVPRVDLAAMLGDLSGAEGTAALRKVARQSGPGTRDLLSVALLGLAKRIGVDATPELLEGLQSRDAAVKDYAVLGLAGAGDDRGWDAAFERLRVVLRRGSHVIGHTEILVAVAYLAQHLDGHPQRKTRLLRELRRRWTSLNTEELRWFASFWPEAAPDGPAPDAAAVPHPARLRTWVRNPFFTNQTDSLPVDVVRRPSTENDGGLTLHAPVELRTDNFQSQGAPRGSVGVVVDVRDSGYDVQLIEDDGWGPLVGPVPSSELAPHEG